MRGITLSLVYPLTAVLSLAGMLWAPDPHWRWLREFCIDSLCQPNLTAMSMEERIHEEVQHYMRSHIAPYLDRPVNTRHSMSHATFNVISLLITGSRVNYNNSDFDKMFGAVKADNQLSTKLLSILSNTPLVSYLVSPYVSAVGSTDGQRLRLYLERQLKQHRKAVDPSQPRDMMDMFLARQANLYRENDKALAHCFNGQ